MRQRTWTAVFVALFVALAGSSSRADITINVANAPTWTSGATHTLGQRIIAGPGWNGSTFTSGTAVYLWALTAGSGGASGADPTVFNTCASPANAGGGLDGTIPPGWSGKTTATDGALTWVCLAVVDYVRLSDALWDETVQWAATTSFYYNNVVRNGADIWIMALGQSNPIVANSPFHCTSGSSGPGASDGNCSWTKILTLAYSSQANRWPHQLYLAGSGASATVQITYNVNMQLWYGGTAQTQYQAGSNGELATLQTRMHQDGSGDIIPFCNSGAQWPYCNGGSSPTGYISPNYVPTMQAVSGDGICNNPGVLAYDATRGVALFSNSNVGNTLIDSGMDDWDGGVVFNCLQFKSVHSIALNGDIGHNANVVIAKNSVIDSGSINGFTADGANYLLNSLVIMRGSGADSCVVCTKYTTVLVNNTLIATAGGTDSTCVAFGSLGGLLYPEIALGAPVISNNLCFGAQHFFATDPAVSGSPAYTGAASLYNATDLGNTDSGTSFTVSIIPFGPLTSAYVGNISGSACGGPCYSLTASTVFQNAATDFRLATNSPVKGAGASFSIAGAGSFIFPTSNAADIYGTSRSASYDIGAWQSATSPPPPVITGPGRMFLR